MPLRPLFLEEVKQFDNLGAHRERGGGRGQDTGFSLTVLLFFTAAAGRFVMQDMKRMVAVGLVTSVTKGEAGALPPAAARAHKGRSPAAAAAGPPGMAAVSKSESCSTGTNGTSDKQFSVGSEN